ncbi:hypothetical protein FOXYSP1_20755 [Fusarium oxysporum f. sp. phaseoli]
MMIHEQSTRDTSRQEMIGIRPSHREPY